VSIVFFDNFGKEYARPLASLAAGIRAERRTANVNMGYGLIKPETMQSAVKAGQTT
jgi:hypothetical protein